MRIVDTNEWLKDYKGAMREDFGEVTPEEKARIMFFLKNGTKLFILNQRKKDLIFPNIEEGPYKNLRTDGEWIWGRDVGYYVRKYSIRPPADFIKHMEEVNFKSAFVDDKKLSEAVSFAMSKLNF